MPPGKKRSFNPEGRGYDYEGARAAGLGPDSTGHWPSRDPKTGLLLKGASHPTFKKTLGAEKRLGYRVSKRKGRYFSTRRESSQ